MQSRYRVRGFLRDPGNFKALAVRPCLVSAAAHEKHRLVRADIVQQLFLRALFIKHPLGISETEVSLVVRMLVYEFSYLGKTFIESPVYIEHHAGQHMSSHDRMTVAVDKSREHHLSLQITDLGIGSAESLCTFSVSHINDPVSFYCNSLSPFSRFIDSIYGSVHIKFVCSHEILLTVQNQMLII